MSPHAALDGPISQCSDRIVVESSKTSPDVNGQNGSDHQSRLQRYDDEQIQDLIGVGFGPASLAIAIALDDALRGGSLSSDNRQPKVRFLEKQARFAWHAGMLLPGTKMQISFIKDMATLRNPQSHFTFLNYLHKNDRLVTFTNLGTFLPQRVEYEDYMRWCASHFEHIVSYGQNVEGVEVGKRDDATSAVEYFNVRSFDQATSTASVLRARHVIVAVGGRPSIPRSLQSSSPRIIHSSQYATSISSMFPPGEQPRSIAVIGGGQSAAEVFHNIPTRFPGAKTYLVIRGSALRPSDDSPFVNEIFDPERVDDIFSQKPAVRADALSSDKATNYGVVRLELLEDIYSTLYTYRIKYASEAEWPQQILTHRAVQGTTEKQVDGRSVVQLHLHNHCSEYRYSQQQTHETLDVDLVVVASGYRRDAHEDLLKSLKPLVPSDQERFSVGRDYRVRFKHDAVAPDAGVWLQGCNESTHGLSDTLLSILAVRGGEIVQSIFGGPQREAIKQRMAN